MNIVEKIKKIVDALENSDIKNEKVDSIDYESLKNSIEENLFYESEGDALIINVLYYLLPESCKIVSLPDEYLYFMVSDVLEAISELSEGNFSVDKIDGYDDDKSYYATFEINHKPEKMSFSSETEGNPKDLLDSLTKSKLSIRYKFLKQNIVYTFALNDIYDEDGAALICYLPRSVVSAISEIVSS